MTQPRNVKFTFDTEFRADGDHVAPAAVARQKKTLTVGEIEAMRQNARAEGEDNAAARSAEAIERVLSALTISLRAVLDQSRAEIETVRAEAANVALAAARKLAAAAIAAQPQGDVEAALREAMHQAIGEPRLVLRAAPDVAALIEPRLTDLAHEEGYEGRVMLSSDPHMSGADCRIEWRGGGAERSFDTIAEALGHAVTQRFSEISSSRVKG